MIPEFNTIKDVPKKFTGECLILYEFNGKEKNPFKCWFKNGIIHREGGPACVWENIDYEQWIQNGEFHRLDGHAVIDIQFKTPRYYIHGREYGLKDYWKHPFVIQHKLKMIMDL